MTTEESGITESTSGESTASTTPNVENTEGSTNEISAGNPTDITAASSKEAAQAAKDPSGVTPVVAADGKISYVPNYKYKAALQEKELDKFWHPLVKDADSEKKVKELFTKVDAFDFIKQRKEAAEQQLQSMSGDFQQQRQVVTKFNQSVANGDLSSAFRLGGISKEAIFKWTQQQLQLMEMPAEQRQQYEQFEAAKQQKSQLEEHVSFLTQQYEHQAVQTRAMQLDSALSRPEVSSFAQRWDSSANQPGAFKQFVIEEAKKVYYDTRQDLSPEEAISSVMQRFGNFLGAGDTAMQSPQAISQGQMQMAKPVIPNITGKAASPIKKVPKSLDDLKKLAREARD